MKVFYLQPGCNFFPVYNALVFILSQFIKSSNPALAGNRQFYVKQLFEHFLYPFYRELTWDRHNMAIESVQIPWHQKWPTSNFAKTHYRKPLTCIPKPCLHPSPNTTTTSQRPSHTHRNQATQGERASHPRSNAQDRRWPPFLPSPQRPTGPLLLSLSLNFRQQRRKSIRRAWNTSGQLRLRVDALFRPVSVISRDKKNGGKCEILSWKTKVKMLGITISIRLTAHFWFSNSGRRVRFLGAAAVVWTLRKWVSKKKRKELSVSELINRSSCEFWIH